MEGHMKTILKPNLMIVIPETPEELLEVAVWKEGQSNAVLAFNQNSGTGMSFRILGNFEDVCRVPINVTSRNPDLQVRLIGNFAATPFTLDGRDYGSVEGFWQSLRYTGSERTRVAQLVGGEAKKAGQEKEYGETFVYEGVEIPVGRQEHWALMQRACEAKFSQCYEAQEALLATGERPLEHRMRHDSKSIPGVIMADIWMKCRKKLRNKFAKGELPPVEETDTEEDE